MYTFSPTRRVHFKPAFWGVDRDLKEVMENMENIWEGARPQTTTHNFKETDKAFLLSLDMPGVNKSTLELQQEENWIHIKGKRKNAFSEEEEAQAVEVSRTVTIPKDVDIEKIEAHLEDGVLYLALPKQEKAQPRKISLTEGGGSWNKLLSDA